MFLIAVAAFSSFARAFYAIYNPAANATWQTGQKATIQWNISGSGSTGQYLTVDLIAGLSTNAQYVTTICDKLPASATSCQWDSVPKWLPTLKTYAVRIGYNDKTPQTYDYTAQFTILGDLQGDANNLPTKPVPVQCIGKCTQQFDNNPSMPLQGDRRTVFDPRLKSSSANLEASIIMVLLLILCLW